ISIITFWSGSESRVAKRRASSRFESFSSIRFSILAAKGLQIVEYLFRRTHSVLAFGLIFMLDFAGRESLKMNPDAVKSTLSNLNFGNVMAAAARDYQKEVLAQGKAQTASSSNEEVDLDELMDDPELEKLHADRIAALKVGFLFLILSVEMKEAEKRQALQSKGHGEYREITEGDFLGEVTGSEFVICHFYHREFYRCKIMDKHLKTLASKHVDTKFVKLDAENAPFFVTKLGIKTLPCVVLFRKGVAIDRVVGFQELGNKDDFTTRSLEILLTKKGIISEKKKDEDEEDVYDESRRRTTLHLNSRVAASLHDCQELNTPMKYIKFPNPKIWFLNHDKARISLLLDASLSADELQSSPTRQVINKIHYEDEINRNITVGSMHKLILFGTEHVSTGFGALYGHIHNYRIKCTGFTDW
uniref:Thioredoxin domain-containing protein n=1 Tax=Kalanchoe fedtschenkoi TaxID=63787 RepID=A0A7N0SX47_KALFE